MIGKRNGFVIFPSTMLGYVCGAERCLRQLSFDINLIRGPVVADLRICLKAVFDKRISAQESRILSKRSHNMQTIDDEQKILHLSTVIKQLLMGFVIDYLINLYLSTRENTEINGAQFFFGIKSGK